MECKLVKPRNPANLRKPILKPSNVEDAQLRTSEKASNSVLKPLLCVAGFLLLLTILTNLFQKSFCKKNSFICTESASPKSDSMGSDYANMTNPFEPTHFTQTQFQTEYFQT
jgi:hypothetical protein